MQILEESGKYEARKRGRLRDNAMSLLHPRRFSRVSGGWLCSVCFMLRVVDGSKGCTVIVDTEELCFSVVEFCRILSGVLWGDMDSSSL